MASVVPYFSQLDREIIWALKLHLPRCTRENGVAPCTATQACSYTYPTCKDKNNFDLGERVWLFCSTLANLPGCLSMLDSHNMQALPTSVEGDTFKTERGELRLPMRDGEPTYLVDPSKSTSPVLATTATSFWPWFKATQVWQGMTAELYYGFYGMDLADFELFFRGRLKEIKNKGQGVTLKVMDRLWKLADNKCPSPVGTDVVLTTIYNGGATMYVNDASNLQAASADQPRQVMVEDEIVQYTGINTGVSPHQITGCTAGAYGTSATSHAIGVEVKHVQVYGDINQYDSVGVSADGIYLDLLITYGRVPVDSIGWVWQGHQLTANITAVATSIPWKRSAGDPYIPERGYAWLENELISWNGANSTTLLNCKRGLFGTTAAAHAINIDINIVTFSAELEQWLPGTEYQAKLTEPTAVKNLVEGLQRCTNTDAWQDEDGFIKGKYQSPPAYGTTPPQITNAHYKPGSQLVDDNDERRVTRVYAYYDGLADPGEDIEDYTKLLVYVGVEEESANWYGEPQPIDLFLPFIFRDTEARRAAGAYYNRFSDGLAIIEQTMELYHMGLRVTDLAFIDTDKVVDEQGLPTNRLYRLTRKEFVQPNTLKMKFEDTGYGSKRFGLIGYTNATLNAALPIAQLFMDLDISGVNNPPLEAFSPGGGAVRVVGTHATGVYGGGTFEDILYTGVTDLGGSVIRLTGLSRAQNGTAAAAWGAGLDVTLQFYGSDLDLVQERYGFQGDANNQLDSDGDYASDTDGYIIF